MKSSHLGHSFIMNGGLANLQVLILQSFNKRAKITNVSLQYLPKSSLRLSTIRNIHKVF